MDNQKTINFLGNTLNQPTKFKAKTGLKQMMTHVKHITPIIKLNLKFQC